MTDKKDAIYKSANSFSKLLNTEYNFIVARNRKSRQIMVNFIDTDFHHLAGLQYLTDIAIPKNKKDTIKNIINCNITDDMLSASKFYKGHNTDEKNIEHRIQELAYLEEYLDTNNIIKIFSTRNTPYTSSFINAEYIIESSLKHRNKTVYIFLKSRKEDESHYSIVSFFEKNNIVYSGDALYWMLKEKVIDGRRTVLFQHSNYISK